MQRYLRFIIPLVVVVVFVAALWLLHQELREYHLRDVIASLEQIPASHLALAVLLTVLNYTVLIGYDLIATRHIGRRLPFQQVAFASFLGYVSAYNFGSLLGATTVRYRLYSSWGLSTVEIVKLIAMLVSSFLSESIDPIPGFWFRHRCIIIWGLLSPDQLFHHVFHQNQGRPRRHARHWLDHHSRGLGPDPARLQGRVFLHQRTRRILLRSDPGCRAECPGQLRR